MQIKSKNHKPIDLPDVFSKTDKSGQRSYKNFSHTKCDSERENKKFASRLRWLHSKDKLEKKFVDKFEDISPKRFFAFEPKTACRFLVETDDIPVYLIKECSRPSFCIRDGVKDWDYISITLYDAISPSGSDCVMKKLESGNKWNFTIKLLGPVGDIVETWKVEDAEVTSVDFSGLNWSANEPASVRVLLKPTKATLIAPS